MGATEPERRTKVSFAKVVLIVCAVAFLLPPATAAPRDVDPDSRFTIGRVKYGGGGDWYSDPTSLPNLLEALRERTHLEVTERETNLSVGDEALFRHPFLYLTGHGAVKFTDDEVARLRDYLERGGFLWADDNYGMDPHFRAQMNRVFPDRRWVDLPFDHPIYHCFYDFESGPPKIHEHDGKHPQGLGMFDRGRLVAFYTYESDIGDGLEDATVHDALFGWQSTSCSTA